MLNQSNIPRYLISSWNRCKDYGVDRYHVNNDLLSGGELTDRKARMKELLESSSGVLDNLYQQLKHQLFMLVLSDPDGYIVAKWGDPPFTNQAKKVWLDIGANWREDIKGTNAIGTALTELQPVTVWGEQHYCQENHFLTCYASPLFSPTGELLGVLDISGDARMHHHLALGMVVAAAQACQARLLLWNAEKEMVLRLQEADAIAEGANHPLLSIDENGIITRINLKASKLFGLPQAKCIGQPLSRWFGQKNTITILSSRNPTMIDLKESNDSFTEKQPSWLIQPVLDHRKKIFRVLLSTRPVHTSTPKTNPSNIKQKETFQPGVHIFHCPKVKQIYRFALQVAKTESNILIYGETGTGKDIFAKEIHNASERKGAFVIVNCGAIPEPLIESELFGYEKGAFTGARNDGHKGKFEAASEGTLFLDEIGEMPLSSQVALLRVLEDRSITRIGSNSPVPVNVRIIAATNKNLAQEVAEGRFRADLYYRLREVELILPPLKMRTDLHILVEYFLDQVAQELGKIGFSIDGNVKKRFSQYDWPGNIRELRQVIRQAAFHAYFSRESSFITEEDLSLPHPSTRTMNLLGCHEEEVIARTIQATGGNLTESARLLGIGRTTLYRKLSQYPALQSIRSQFKKSAGNQTNQ